MKKIFILSSLLLFGLASCQDVNDDFNWLDDATKPKDIVDDTIKISEPNIATIVTKAKGTADEAYATQLSKDKMFSDLAPAENLIPYLLPTIYFSPDPGSSVLASYQFKNNRDALLAGLSTSTNDPAYVLGDKDYEAVWGSPFATALTPKKSPEKQLPKLLANNFPNAENGSYKVIEYAYSTEEPVSATAIGKIYYEHDFEGLGIEDKKPVVINGWLNVDLEGTKPWFMKTYNKNSYAEMSSYGSKGKNDSWLIMSPIDLKGATNPHLTFGITVGNYKTSCLSILVSTDFDGTQTGIKSATWKDISSDFDIPTPATGYSPSFASAGFGSLETYKDKKVYIAFRYMGDENSTPQATTTYQIENIKVAEAVPGIAVESKKTVYTAYQKVNDVWKSAETSDIIVLQPENYTIEKPNNTYFAATDAQRLISGVLIKQQQPQIAGLEKVVIYKTSATVFYADRLTYSNDNAWTINSVVETKSSQFILTNDRKWLFDPTFVLTMTAPDYQIVVDYVINHQAIDNSKLINSYKNTEYYYGFNSNNKNITYREKDRVFDPAYPATGTDAQKEAFCDERSIEGLEILLATKYPDAQPDVSGIEQKAKITTTIFTGPAASNTQKYVYELQCIGTKEWKFLSREAVN